MWERALVGPDYDLADTADPDEPAGVRTFHLDALVDPGNATRELIEDKQPPSPWGTPKDVLVTSPSR